jgi:hypothetical protein
MIEGSHGRNEVGETYFLDLTARKHRTLTEIALSLIFEIQHPYIILAPLWYP